MVKYPTCSPEEPFKIYLNLNSDADADDFRNVLGSSLSIDTTMVKFSQRSDQCFIMLSCSQSQTMRRKATNAG